MRRKDSIEAGAHHGDAAAAAGEPAAVGRRVDAAAKPADDSQAGRRQCRSESLGVAVSLRGGIATAHDGKRRPIEQLAPAHVIENRRGVRDREQGRGVIRIVPGEQRMPGPGKPCQRAFELAWVGTAANGGGELARHEARQGCLRGAAHGHRVAQRLEQRHDAARTEAGDELQPRPSLDAGVDLHRRALR